MAMVFTLIGVGAVTSQIMRGLVWLDNVESKKNRRRNAEQAKERTTEELLQALMNI